jgi:DNA-binding transcriptional MerR regulator
VIAEGQPIGERERAEPAALRMKDLCELTGVPRQAIHFYIKEGLLPPGRKTGRNMAFYGPEHVERIKLIRQLQHERFLPLKAIRAMLEREDEEFSPEQRRLLADVRSRLGGFLGGTSDTPETPVEALPLLARAGLDRQDLEDLEHAGLLHAREEVPGRPLIAASDAWVVELWGELRAAGMSRAYGFTAMDLAPVQGAVAAIFEHETRVLAARVAHLPPDEVARIVERSLPLVNTLLARYHITLARRFLAAMPNALNPKE